MLGSKTSPNSVVRDSVFLQYILLFTPDVMSTAGGISLARLNVLNLHFLKLYEILALQSNLSGQKVTTYQSLKSNIPFTI